MVRFSRDQGLLGIAVGEHALLVAEVNLSQTSGPTAKVAEFTYPADISIEDGNALGKALAHFLQWHGFSARRVVIGVPAKWLISRPYQMPPADAATTSSVLWLHAADSVPAELGKMTFDYVGQSSPTESTNLLLVGLQDRFQQRLMAVAKAAGLKALSITPTSIACAAATGPHASRAWILSFCLGNAELIVQDGRQTKALRHIAPAANQPAIIADLRRSASTASAEGWNLVIWNDAGADPAFVESLRGASNLPVIEGQSQWLDVGEKIESNFSAITLTLPERNGERPAIDFLHPRLVPPRERRHRPPAFWIAAAAAAILLAVALMLGDLAHLNAQVSSADDQIQLLSPAVDAARRFVANSQFAASFEPRSPRCVACVRDLTVAFGDDQSTYITSFAARGVEDSSDLVGEVVGHSTSGQQVLNLVDKLNAVGKPSAPSGRFKDVNCRLDPFGNRHNGNSNGYEVSFILTFSYIPQS